MLKRSLTDCSASHAGPHPEADVWPQDHAPEEIPNLDRLTILVGFAESCTQPLSKGSRAGLEEQVLPLPAA